MSAPTLKLYDSLTRTVKPLVTLEPGVLKFYTCGPTVYSYAHIGNFRSFLTADLIVRTAKAIGLDVIWVTNITDVGHLTEDDVADAQGEDKMAKALRSKEGEHFNNVWELAEFYEDAYKEDWRKLNLSEPSIRPKATQHVREQILAAQTLIDKGFAYETPTGVYFRVEAFPEYGKLSGNTQEKLRRGVREVVQDDNKQDQSDFAVWKKDDKHLMQWFSPYGWGFPGWHIECSVMARAYLGDTIDLHSGGEDNMFPHHECEIAQSEALTGKPFCNHWVHTRFLQVNGEKMAKSAGNFYTVRMLLERGLSPLAIRYALIAGQYGKPYNFTDQTLSDAELNVERYKRATLAAQEAVARGGAGEDSAFAAELTLLYQEALEAMCEDLNTPVALAKGLAGARAITRIGDAMTKVDGERALDFLEKLNNLLGIVHSDYEEEVDSKPEEPTVSADEAAEIEALIEKRKEAKKAKDFATADAIRKDLSNRGITLVDNPDGTVSWSRG